MTLEQLVETVLIRAFEDQNEAGKRLYRWEIEALVPGALARLFQRLQQAGKASKLLRKTTLTTGSSTGVLALPSNLVISSLEAGGDGYLFFAEGSYNNYLPISYEPIYENRYLKRPMPGQYFYSITPSTTGSEIRIYQGDGLATPPSGELSIELVGLFIPASTDVTELDVETAELLVEVLIEIARERAMADQIPTTAPANVPTRIVSAPSQQ